MPGILPERINITPVPVAWLWQGCWMQISSHNLQAQATLPCKRRLGHILFQEVLQDHMTGRQNHLPQTLHRMWIGKYTLDPLFPFGIFLHCVFTALSFLPWWEGRRITDALCFFTAVTCTAETRVLSLPWRYHLILPRQSPGHNVLQGSQPFFLKTCQQLSWQGVPSWPL